MTRQTGQHAQQLTQVITKTVRVDYLLYLPPDYNEDPKRRWPMILFLHGTGERGHDLEKVRTHGPPKHIAQGRDYPFVVVSPQCPPDQWWDPDVLFALLDTVAETARIDVDRIYVTGLSMGGYATWSMATRQPDRFAAIAPICGGGDATQAYKLKALPIWAFHGEKDTAVSPKKSKQMVAAVNKAGGNARLTLYPNTRHDSWTRAYEDPALFEWFLSHRRTSPSP